MRIDLRGVGDFTCLPVGRVTSPPAPTAEDHACVPWLSDRELLRHASAVQGLPAGLHRLRLSFPCKKWWTARTSGELLSRFVPLMKSVDLTDRLREIRCPTLAVVPDHDPISSMAQYEVLRERIADCEFVVYHGLPHNITDAVPDRCADELRRFLLKHRSREAGETKRV